jgi:NADH-quinone oxidoreductase subunit N
VAIVVGSAISLAYYLRVVAAVWMRAPEARPLVGPGAAARPAIAGGSQEADAELAAVAAARPRRLVQPEVVGVAVVCAAATIFFGVYPAPLLDLAHDAGAVFSDLF